MSPAAPEATNRARTTPRRDGVARVAGRGGEVATATGRTPRRSVQTRRRLPDGGPTWQAVVHSPRVQRGKEPLRPGRRHNHQTPTREGDMRRGRMAVGMALVAMVIVTGCSSDGGGGGGSAGADTQVAPAADQAMTEQDRSSQS